MQASELSKAGVVGAGQMGAGIAQVLAQRGLSVLLADVSLETALHALADDIRLQIVRELAAAEGACACGSIDIDVSKATRSHHFKTLREAGLTTYIIHGRTHEMRLRRDELNAKFPGLLEAVTTPQG